MFEREFHQHVADAMHEIAKEIERTLPEEVVKDLHEMASIQAGITKRLHTNRAIELEKIQRYNELCYKHFGKMQDGEEFTKEEPEPETKIPVTQRRFDFGEALHLLKDGQNWKWLISSTIPDGMYYELTYNGDKDEYYLDAYKKFENKVIKGGRS